MKKLIRLALRKPIATIVAVLAIIYFSVLAINKIKVDVFPEVEAPAIYIATPYGGLSPEYMDGFMSNQFQRVLVFVNGVENLEFKSIQGLSLMKLTFYPGTDMAQAQADVATQVSRAMAFLPPGAVPPQVVRFDAGAQPIGQLVFESEQRSIGEIQSLVVSRIRPAFVTIGGISGTAPFGGNNRTMVTNINPKEMRAHGLTPEEVMTAISKNNFPSPDGNVQIGDVNFMAPSNTLLRDSEDFMNTPIKSGSGPTVYIRDIANVVDQADKTTGYAMVNGERTVYLPVIKKASASTLSAINNLKNNMPMLRDNLPEDVKMDFVFDQSSYIENALTNLMSEGILGAILTGLMVLLFLGDRRGALIVILTIPISLLSAVIMLYLMGQTINIMTLSGLALSIGILVDETVVTIENIHQHFEKDKSKPRAIIDALFEISVPKLLILLSILAVLTPSLMMVGIPKDMFMPLSIAVGSAMIASFLASQTFVPVMANWIMKHNPEKYKNKKVTKFDKFKNRYVNFIEKKEKYRYGILISYIVGALALAGVLFTFIGTDILPPSDSKDLQIRITGEEGMALDKTEEYVMAVEDHINEEIAPQKLKVTSAMVGMHSPNTPINGIFLFNTGSHDAVFQFSLPDDFNQPVGDFKKKIRNSLNEKFPELNFTFEPMELVEKIMGQGYDTPIAIEILGKDLNEIKDYAGKIRDNLREEDYLTDVHLNEPIDYPSIAIEIDRERVGQLGLELPEVSSALTTATSSSRYVDKNLWVDPNSGLVFQVQVQFPEDVVNSLNDLRNIPLKPGSSSPILDDVADIQLNKQPGQVNRKGPNRFMTVTANTFESDLGSAAKKVQGILDGMEQPPRGYKLLKAIRTEVFKMCWQKCRDKLAFLQETCKPSLI
ncbi:MAG TPA: efflux RND transporter permease subunit [Flavobacteriaceae bacterium]|nr:efflux RND transporter permease subunit [Flavobacteriaceae bacterium]